MTRSLNHCVDSLSALRNCTRASENGHLIAEECPPYREGLISADLTTSFHIELDVRFATESHHHRFLGDSPDYLKGAPVVRTCVLPWYWRTDRPECPCVRRFRSMNLWVRLRWLFGMPAGQSSGLWDFYCIMNS